MRVNAVKPLQDNELTPLSTTRRPSTTADDEQPMNTDTKQQILDSISKTGSVESNNIINGNIDHIISRSSGLPRIQTNALRHFSLILSQPQPLRMLSALAIRCALCKRVISYPCWYYSIKYTVNFFHYFICFDKDSANKPSTSCYRKDV
jgi:hypothetical protein